ncbi:MAG: hypothetical protein A4E53_02845 [Pelotomaculum sp. PtaB.Bin104]|nr:MAG: hypothetical protein A4E53_02845 [Pelotomaculum sp. PtaB.Bin104]
MSSKKWRLGAVLIAAMILTGAVAGISFASEDQTGPPDMKALCQSFVAKLAVNLGIDESTLTAAMETTRQEIIDEAVEAGTITQEQADKLSAMNKDGFCVGFGFLGGKGGPYGRGPGLNLEQMAGVLGMTAEELKAELDAGKKFEDIANAQGLTMEQFKEKMKEARQAEIAQAVADGKLTQAQADEMLQRIEQNRDGRGLRGHGPCGSGKISDNTSNASE